MSDEEDSASLSGPSSEQGEDDASSEEEEEEEEEEEAPPPIQLPDRTSRGKRMGQLLDEDGSADEDFWQQDFFAEEGRDEEYEESTEEEDVPDADFSEEEADDSGSEQEADEKRPRKAKLKPPGAPKAPKRMGPTARKRTAEERAAERQLQAAALAALDAPTVRQSTRQRTEDAERDRLEQVRPRKKHVQPEARQLTQEELLAEAAQTEIDNAKSLQLLEALEEEVKKRGAVKAAKYTGPLLRTRSLQVDGAALTTLEVMNMLVPPELQPQKAPRPAKRSACAVTGLPARYRDPVTGLPYHDLAAYRTLAAHYHLQE